MDATKGGLRATRPAIVGSAAESSNALRPELRSAEDGFGAVKGILLGILLSTVIWAGIGAAAYFTLAP